MALMAWNWIVYVTGVAQLLTDIVLKQWGAKAGDVMVIPAPLDDQTVTILRNLLVAIISGDPSVGVKAIDLKPLFDKIGVPMREAFDQDAMVQEADDAKKAELAAGKGTDGNTRPTSLKIRSNLTA